MCRPSFTTSSWVSSRQNRPRRSPEVLAYCDAPNSLVHSSLQSWVGHLLLPLVPLTHLWPSAGKTDWYEDVPVSLPLQSSASQKARSNWILQAAAKTIVSNQSLLTKRYLVNLYYRLHNCLKNLKVSTAADFSWVCCFGNTKSIYRLACVLLGAIFP